MGAAQKGWWDIRELRWIVSIVVLTVVSSLGPAVPQARAAVIVVTQTTDANGACDGDGCSLREAILLANTTPEPDEIVLPAGYHKLRSDLGFGQLAITEPLTISGAGSGSTQIIGVDAVDDLFLGRIFDMTTTGEVVLTGVAIRGAKMTTGSGGAIRSTAALTLDDVAITDSTTTGFGGAIFVPLPGSADLTGVTLQANSASTDGGAIYSEGVVTLTDSTVYGNSAPTGGGIYSDGTLTLTDSTIRANVASQIGGGVRNGGTLIVTRSSLLGNHASSEGGAIENSGPIDMDLSTVTRNTSGDSGAGIHTTSGNVDIELSRLSANLATDFGSGMHIEGGSVTLRSSVVDGHDTVGGGAGAWLDGGTLDVRASSFYENQGDCGGVFMIASGTTVTTTASTFSGNRSRGGCGGGGVAEVLAGGTATFRSSTLVGNAGNIGGAILSAGATSIVSSIVFGNSSPSGPDCSGAVTSGGYNVVGTATGCPSNGTGDVTSAPASFMAPLMDNGGPTPTRRIAPGSLPVGRAGADPACDGTTTDQRGVLRPDDACDAGAYELTLCRGTVVNVVGTQGSDDLFGGPGQDGMLGLGGNDVMRGNDGNDALCGGSGRDKLFGGGGNDMLDGGSGTDTCTGGAGTDRFRNCERVRR